MRYVGDTETTWTKMIWSEEFNIEYFGPYAKHSGWRQLLLLMWKNVLVRVDGEVDGIKYRRIPVQNLSAAAQYLKLRRRFTFQQDNLKLQAELQWNCSVLVILWSWNGFQNKSNHLFQNFVVHTFCPSGLMYFVKKEKNDGKKNHLSRWLADVTAGKQLHLQGASIFFIRHGDMCIVQWKTQE